MSQQEGQKSFNATFDEIKRWKASEKSDLVLSLITDNDTGDKRYFLNKQWTTKDGKKGTGKGSTIPSGIAVEVASAIIAHSTGGKTS